MRTPGHVHRQQLWLAVAPEPSVELEDAELLRPPELPGTYLGVGGTPRANALAAAEAWPTVLSFFRNMSD
jgi:hypothetical protein